MVETTLPCWCVNQQIPKKLLDLVPEVLVNKSCICISCIQSYKEDSVKFESSFRSDKSNDCVQ